MRLILVKHIKKVIVKLVGKRNFAKSMDVK